MTSGSSRAGGALANRDDGAEGFAHPALQALEKHFPLTSVRPDPVQVVERLHAEAEISRIEALRLRVRAAANRSAEAAGGSDGGERNDADRWQRLAQDLERHSDRLFEEAARTSREERVEGTRPPFESMRDWLRRLATLDPAVDPEVDQRHVIWMSLARTLADHANLSRIRRALGVGVGFDGPEVFYNDLFAEHYCLDLVDYSDRNPHLKFVTADIEKGVDFPDSCFDLVYSHSVFEHLKDVDRAMTEIDRLVRLGGYIYVTISPLYYSPAGSHVNFPVALARWEHLDPSSEHYLLDTPDRSRIDQGVFLNRLTISAFLAAVGRVGWEIRHFAVKIVHPRDVPLELKARFPLVDLVAEELRFVGRKVIPKSAADES